jgi:ParB-like chromosome segregation protein Spo0J
MRGSASEELLASLRPGRLDCLKTRPDGMILDGHHRLKVLRERGVNVNTLPREIHEKGELQE